MLRLLSRSILIASLFFPSHVFAGVLVGEEDGDPSHTSNYCWALKFANGNVTNPSDAGVCSIADQSSAGGGNSLSVSEDGTAVVDNRTNDMGLDFQSGFDLAGGGQDQTVSLDASEVLADASTNGFIPAVTMVSIDVLIAASHDSQWVDTGSILHPSEETVDEVVVGGTTEAGADHFLGVAGDVVHNEQGLSTGDLKWESDNNDPMLFGDASADCLAINQSSCVDTFEVTGEVEFTHTAVGNDEHAFELIVDAAGFADVKGLEIEYDTGAIVGGEIAAVILININEIDATSGDVLGIEILATDGGSDNVVGIKIGAEIAPLLQDSGSFADPSLATNDTVSTDVLDMRDGSTGTNTTIFAADDDFIIIGADAAFTEIEFVIETGFGNPGIQPTFAFSTSGTNQFTNFGPTDGTDGFKNAGAFVVAWDTDEVPGHVADDVTGKFDIRVTRTANPAGNVSLFYAKSAATVTFEIDKSGNARFLTYSFEGATDDAFEQKLDTIDPTADRTFIFPNDEMVAGDVLVASDTSDLEYLNLTTTQIVIGDGSGIPTAAALSGDVTMDNGGIVSIAADAVSNDEIAPQAVSTDQLRATNLPSDGQFFAYEVDTPGFGQWVTSSGSPGGSDSQVQYENGGSFGGAAGMNWDDSTNIFSIASGSEANFASADTLTIPRGSTLVDDGQIAIKISADSLVIQSGSGTAGQIAASQDVALPFIDQKDFTLVEPDQIQTVSSDVRVMAVDTYNYPNGIKVTALRLTVSESASPRYTFEEWDATSGPGLIETIGETFISSGIVSTDTTLINADVAAGSYVFVSIDTTNVGQVGGTIWFYAKD